jgi:hypothetical protein
MAVAKGRENSRPPAAKLRFYPPQILAGFASASPASQDYACHSANSTLYSAFTYAISVYVQIVAKDYRELRRSE